MNGKSIAAITILYILYLIQMVIFLGTDGCIHEMERYESLVWLPLKVACIVGKEIYTIIGVLIISLFYLCTRIGFYDLRKRGIISEDAKQSYISYLLFSAAILSTLLLAPYEFEGSIVGSILGTFCGCTGIAISLSYGRAFTPMKGYFIAMIIFCSLCGPPLFFGLVSWKEVVFLLLCLAYFAASIVEVRRKRLPFP
jgi:hypothetical protein